MTRRFYGSVCEKRSVFRSRFSSSLIASRKSKSRVSHFPFALNSNSKSLKYNTRRCVRFYTAGVENFGLSLTNTSGHAFPSRFASVCKHKIPTYNTNLEITDLTQCGHRKMKWENKFGLDLLDESLEPLRFRDWSMEEVSLD